MPGRGNRDEFGQPFDDPEQGRGLDFKPYASLTRRSDPVPDEKRLELNPGFDVAQVSHPHIQRIFLGQFSPWRLAKEGLRVATASSGAGALEVVHLEPNVVVGISEAVADVRISTVDIPSSDSASDTLAALLPMRRGSVLVIFLLPEGWSNGRRSCGIRSREGGVVASLADDELHRHVGGLVLAASAVARCASAS